MVHLQVLWSLDTRHRVPLVQCSILQTPTQQRHDANTPSSYKTSDMPVIQMDVFTLSKVAREAQEEHEDHAQLVWTVNMSKYYSISEHTCNLTKLA